MFFRNMSSSETTGNSPVAFTQFFTGDSSLHLGITVSAFPSSSHCDSSEGAFSRLDYGSLALRPVASLALLSELTRLASSQRGRLHPGFRRFGHPHRRRISLQCQLGNLHWQDFHLLDHQLASLHYPNALRPPFVFEGDVAAADTFWTGDLLNSWAEDWVSYWTHEEGSFAMSAFEDAAIGQALQFLSQVGRADKDRLLVLRGGSDYTVQPQGETPAQYLASENSGGLSGFQEALNDLYQVGSIVVRQLSGNRNACANQIPRPNR